MAAARWTPLMPACIIMWSTCETSVSRAFHYGPDVVVGRAPTRYHRADAIQHHSPMLLAAPCAKQTDNSCSSIDDASAR